MEKCRDCGKEVSWLHWEKCEECEFHVGKPCLDCGGSVNERKWDRGWCSACWSK